MELLHRQDGFEVRDGPRQRYLGHQAQSPLTSLKVPNYSVTYLEVMVY